MFVKCFKARTMRLLAIIWTIRGITFDINILSMAVSSQVGMETCGFAAGFPDRNHR